MGKHIVRSEALASVISPEKKKWKTGVLKSFPTWSIFHQFAIHSQRPGIKFVIFLVLFPFLKWQDSFTPITHSHPLILSGLKIFTTAGETAQQVTVLFHGTQVWFPASTSPAHNLLWPQLWRIWRPLLAFRGTFTLVHIITGRHKCTNS